MASVGKAGSVSTSVVIALSYASAVSYRASGTVWAVLTTERFSEPPTTRETISETGGTLRFVGSGVALPDGSLEVEAAFADLRLRGPTEVTFIVLHRVAPPAHGYRPYSSFPDPLNPSVCGVARPALVLKAREGGRS